MSDAPEQGERAARRISWVKAARKDFVKFPKPVQTRVLTALEIAAGGKKADIAKPMKGLGSRGFQDCPGTQDRRLPDHLRPSG